MLQVDFEGINKELAAGVYNERSAAATEPEKSRAGGGSRSRLSPRGRMVPVRAYPRRAVRRKGPKTSDWTVAGPPPVESFDEVRSASIPDGSPAAARYR